MPAARVVDACVCERMEPGREKLVLGLAGSGIGEQESRQEGAVPRHPADHLGWALACDCAELPRFGSEGLV